MADMPLEIEKKYIIIKPDFAFLATQNGYTRSSITQTYLESAPNVTHRVRKREWQQRVEYTECSKIRIARDTAIEDERVITEEEYSSLLKSVKPGTRPITKERTTFRYGELVFEVDVYPEWGRCCIMEVELPSSDYPLNLPPFITVVDDVTGVKGYSNASMSHSFPDEPAID